MSGRQATAHTLHCLSRGMVFICNGAAQKTETGQKASHQVTGDERGKQIVLTLFTAHLHPRADSD